MITKQARLPFPRQSTYRAEKPLELLHADICGPISPCTLAGNKYFLLIVDNSTRWMWLYMLEAKSDAFEAFKKFKFLMENKTEYKIRRFRRIEVVSSYLQSSLNFAKKKGIERHLTAPYSPQQNGIVECRNRTVMAMTRSLLKSMHVPAKFWGEAVRHAVYLLNRLPTKALGERTPFEAWMGRKPHLAHLRVFGCVAYVKNTTPHLKKLDDRSSPMVYFGVEEGCKAHRLYDPGRGKLQISRDVLFQENLEWAWNEVVSDGKEITEFQVMDQFYSDEFENLEDAETGVENVLPHATEIPAIGETSPSPPSTNTPVRLRSLSDIYANTEEVVGGDEQENEVMMVVSEEPTCYQEAVTEGRWYEAMKNELKSIEKNNTWSLTELPLGYKPIGLKWVFKLKKDPNGEVVKHKARLVAKGYVQRQGIDFEEVFAPVARLNTIRVILALAANQSWEVHHLDVKSAFLNGELEEEVYVTQPEGFEVPNEKHKVYRLSNALYGLRQAPQAWNIRLDRSLKDLGFRKCTQEQAIYTRREKEECVLVGVYVDDLIVTGSSIEKVNKFKQ